MVIKNQGIIKNFNKDVVNQFFPTMLKTKISSGKSTNYLFMISDPTLEEKFVKIMKRSKRDSMNLGLVQS